SRLALSGWIRGRTTPVARKTRVYVESPHFMKKRSEVEAALQGSLACYRLRIQQRAYNGLDTEQDVAKESELVADYEAHMAAPDGTSFLHRVPGPQERIIVLNGDTDGKITYFGSFAAYERSKSLKKSSTNSSAGDVAAPNTQPLSGGT